MPRTRPLVLLALAALLVASGRGPATTRAAASPAAARPLPFFYDLYTFRGDTGTAVVASFAVAAGELEREESDRGVRYRFDVFLGVIDHAVGSVIGRFDSVHVDVPRPLPRDHVLFTSVELQAKPSGTTVHRVLMFNPTAPGIGQLYSSPFPIPDYSGDALMLSDIALGHTGGGDGWKRGDVTLALLPTGQFPSSAFEVYYEIYNLPASTAYTTQLVVERVNDRDEPVAEVVRIRFAGQTPAAATAYVPELRRVETSLPRGRYRITATIQETAGGRSASRSRAFAVHAAVAGTTLVPALPVGGGPQD